MLAVGLCYNEEDIHISGLQEPSLVNVKIHLRRFAIRIHMTQHKKHILIEPLCESHVIRR